MRNFIFIIYSQMNAMKKVTMSFEGIQVCRRLYHLYVSSCN